MTKHILTGLALAAGLAGCGGGGPSTEDFLGVYLMSSHRENHGQGVYVPCDDPGSDIQPSSPAYAPYFAIAVDPFFMDPNILQLQACDSSDPSSCTDAFISLAPGGDGLEKVDSNTAVSGGTCSLYATRSTAILTDTTVTVEERHWDAFDQPVDCTLNDADALLDTADCRDVVVWVGSRL